MFEYINGKIVVKKIDYVAIDINGLAYKIFISLKTFENLSDIGQEQKLFLHMEVKENDISLYGFNQENEREIFRALISINGVGPKLAIAILSTFNSREIVEIVNNDENKIFTRVPGLGAKKAQKIILDLKDKVKKMYVIEKENLFAETVVSHNDDTTSFIHNKKVILMKEDLQLALESLGYKDDIESIVTDSEIAEFSDIAEGIKIILQKIQKKS